MSDLKWCTLSELEEYKAETLKYIGKLRGKINNQETRLHWIEHYIDIKTKPVEMTFEEVEKAIGHKIKIILEVQHVTG